MAPASGYNLPVPGPNDPLTSPSHSALHSSANNAVNDLDRRVGAVEDAAPGVSFDIEQARLAAHTVMVRGPISEALVGTVLVPVIWNLTGRTVTFQGAKVTLMDAADADFVIDIVNGQDLADNQLNSELQTSILADGPLVVPAGEHFSVSLGVDDFVGVHPQQTYVAVALLAAGSEDLPGGSLTVQLDRLL